MHGKIYYVPLFHYECDSKISYTYEYNIEIYNLLFQKKKKSKFILGTYKNAAIEV